MAIKYRFVTALLILLLVPIAKAEEIPVPDFEADADPATDVSEEIPAAATAPVPARRPLAVRGATANSNRGTAKSSARRKQSGPALISGQTPPARTQPDPNARPIAEKVGQPDVMKAFELTKTAETEEGYTEIIELCKNGMQKGVDTKMAKYARSLSGWAYNRRGEARANAGQTKEAFDDFDSAVAMDPKGWRAAHNRGVSYAMLGNQQAAIADFTRAIELNPKFSNAWFNRGELLYEKRDFVGAVRDYNQAIRLAPGDAVAYNSRGHALYRQRRGPEALADYNKALEIDPSSAAAYVNRGDLLADQGEFAAAAKDYRTAIKVNPSLGRAYQSAAWLMATCPEEKFRNADLAMEAAEKAIALDGDGDYRYLETLAAAQANAGEYEKAVKTQEQAVAAAPEAIAEIYKARLAKFRDHRPHREPAAKLATGSPAASRR